MTYPTPPNIGDTNWGTELNGYLDETLAPEVNQVSTAFANHVAAAPVTATGSDPHGDRAFAQQLFAPLSQNVNGASGFVQLNGQGAMPLSAWQDFRPVTNTFTTEGTPQSYPPQYQADMSGRVWLAGYFYTGSGSYNGQRVFVNSLPSALRPNFPVNVNVTLNASGTGTSFGSTPIITIGTDGSVTLGGCPAALPAGTAVGIYGWYPLDAYYSLIQE